MRNLVCLIALLGILVALDSAAQGAADSVAKALLEQMKALQESVEELKSTVQDQQKQIDELKQENETLKTAPSQASAAAAAPVTAAKAAQSSVPEIGAILDIVATSSEDGEDEEGNDRLSARELELTLGYDVDPFTRLDATISFSDFEEASLEDAYVTYLGLPNDIHFKGGKFKPRAGKAVAIHRDSLDTVDEPLVVQRFFGVEGLSKAGIEFSRYLPQFNPKLTQEFIVGVLEGGSGEDGEMFGETRRRPTYYAHLKNYWDISEMSNVEFGATFLRGSADPDARDEVNAVGLDLTYVYYVTPNNKLKWQTELYYQDRRETKVFDNAAAVAYTAAALEDLQRYTGNVAAVLTGDTPSFSYPVLADVVEGGPVRTSYDAHPWGLYTLIDYRLSPRFGIGGRLDYVEPVFRLTSDPRSADKGFAAYITYYQSEFARLRLQFEHIEFASGDDDNRFYLQGTYAIGIHKHALK
jgi:FtsZ-binding cell division protein ZapB